MTDNRPPLTSRNPRPDAPPASPGTSSLSREGAGARHLLTLDELEAFVRDARELRVPGDSQFEVGLKAFRLRRITTVKPK